MEDTRIHMSPTQTTGERGLQQANIFFWHFAQNYKKTKKHQDWRHYLICLCGPVRACVRAYVCVCVCGRLLLLHRLRYWLHTVQYDRPMSRDVHNRFRIRIPPPGVDIGCGWPSDETVPLNSHVVYKIEAYYQECALQDSGNVGVGIAGEDGVGSESRFHWTGLCCISNWSILHVQEECNTIYNFGPVTPGNCMRDMAPWGVCGGGGS